jgi:hypothetical protein
VTLAVMSDTSHALLDAYEAGALDPVILHRDDDRRDGKVLGPEHFGWLSQPIPSLTRANRCRSPAFRPAAPSAR